MNTTLLEYFKETGANVIVDETRESISDFGNVESEYSAIKNSCSVRYISGNCVLELTGSDVLDYLNRISTNDLKFLSTLVRQ